MEFGFLTFERLLLSLTFVLFFAFLVVNTVQQRRTQAELKEIKQQMQGTLVELKQFKESVPHREFSSLAIHLSIPFTPSQTKKLTSTSPIPPGDTQVCLRRCLTRFALRRLPS